MTYLGDYAEDLATLNFKFTTRDIQAAGSPPATLGGTPAVSVYKDNDATQSTAGITLTADFDSVTGLNNVLIDLSADAFYATGADYAVVITTGTVNSISVVGEVVGHFSIENRSFERALILKTSAEAPSATPTLEIAIGWLYQNFRNRKDQTAILHQLYADDESTVVSKATVSEVAGLTTKEEMISA